MAGLLVILERPQGSLAGLVLDEKGIPLEEAQVFVDAYPYKIKGTTDGKGEFEIAQIPTGRYYVRIYKRGFKRAYLDNIEIEEGQRRQVKTVKLEPLPPRLYVSLWDTTKIPGEKAALSLSGAKIQTVDFTAYRVDLLAFLRSGYRINQLDQDKSDPSNLPGISRVGHWEYNLPEKDISEFDLKVPLKKEEQPWSSQPGLYLIHAIGTSLDRSQVFSSNTLLNRTDLGFVLKQGEEEMLLLVSSLKEPHPTAEAQVFIFPKNGRPLQLQTNQNGVLVSSTSELGPEASPFVVVQKGAHLAYAYAPGTLYLEEPGEGYSPSGSAEGKGIFTFVYTDRPLYRPGQRVYFKGLARKRTSEGTYRLPENTTADILVEDPRGNILAELNLPVDGGGNFSGAFNLGEEAELGYYTIRSTLYGREYTENFEVDEYRKPEFKIETTPGSEHYFAGDEITFLIDAQYFFGAPVEAQIDWTLYKSHYFYVPPGEGLLPDYWDYYGDEGYVGGYGEYLKDGKVETDDKGHAKVNYETEESSEDFRYTLRMRARDLSERQIEREASIVVTAGDFFFRTERKEFLAFPDKPIDLTVLTRNYENQPVSVKYQIEVKRQRWDPLVKKYEYKKVAKVKGQTDAQGRGVSPIVVPKGGYYHLELSGEDSQGREVAFTDYLWVSGTGKDSEDFGIAKEVKVVPAKKRYEAGEEATLFVVGPEKNGTVLLTVEGDRLFQEQLIQLDGYSKEIRLKLRKEWIPNVFIQASAIGKKAIYQGETQLAISPADNFLQVKIDPDQNQYKPGETITYRVTTLDAQGNPVPARLSLGVVDEKIYALRADKTDIKKFFWGPRPNQVATTYSFSEYYSGGIQKEDRNLLRRNFKDTAYWNANLQTGENGQTEVRFKLPDNLTTWRATVVASTLATAVGQETNKVLSTKPLIVRVAAPRFFTEKDVVYLKAILHNYTDSEQSLQVDLGVEGLVFQKPEDEGSRTLTLPAKTVTAFEFPVVAKDPGEAKVQLLAKNDKVNDGVELKIPILPYGIADKHWSQGVLAASLPDAPASAKTTLALPPRSNPERSSLAVTLDTSFVAQLLGSLSYLVKYPYGCVEQTMSRLLPAIMVAKISADLGLTDPLIERKIPRVIKRGLARIYRMQNSGGGWGWFAQDSQDPFMTAYALYGLLRAREFGIGVEEQVIKDGKGALKKILNEGVPSSSSYLFGSEGTKYFIYYVASLAGIPNRPPLPAGGTQLKPMAQALLALTQLKQGQLKDAQALLMALEREALCEKGLCHLQQRSTYDDRSVMATAWTLQALIQGAVENPYLKGGLARWLLEQRRGGRWRHTLETAVALYSLSQYALELPGTLEGVRAQLWLNQQELEKVQFASPHFVRRLQGCNSGESGCGDGKGLPLQKGENQLKIVNGLEHKLYYQTEFIAFSTEESIAPTSHGITVSKEYFLLKEPPKDRDNQRDYDAQTLPEEIKVGETVGVRITIQCDTDLNYLMIEDPLPSGFEVIQGIKFDSKAAYTTQMSVRDEKVTLFRTRLKKGEHVFNYGLLPELKGNFYVLPTVAEEMYRPEVRGSGASRVLKVRD